MRSEIFGPLSYTELVYHSEKGATQIINNIIM